MVLWLFAMACGKEQGILVNSAGGSASTAVLEALYVAKVPSNQRMDGDKLKHKNANAQRKYLVDCDGGRCIRHDMDYSRVLYVVSPKVAHSIVSTARRWPTMQHQIKLTLGCAECYHPRGRLWSPPTWRGKKGPALYRAIFNSAAQRGRDVYGIQSHFDAWEYAQRVEKDQWPPILIADIHTLVDPSFECALFGFLGIHDDTRAIVADRIKHPDDFVVKNARHKNEAPVIPENYMNAKANAIYANLSRSIASVIAWNRDFYTHTYCRCRGATNITGPIRRNGSNI